MKVITDLAGLSALGGGLFVPTMGALHEGHLTLIRRAAEFRRERPGEAKAMPIVVSVFVNPTQFNDPKDLERYPRTLEADVAGCERAGADAVFAPARDVIYPADGNVGTPALPPVATEPKLEDAHRPGHFAGVCQVVKRLFEVVRPRAAFFGEKDWQQLQVIAAMTAQEKLGVAIVPVATVREPSGLAMSSRNVFLSGHDRTRACGLSRALFESCSAATPAEAEGVMREVLGRHQIVPEYAVVREAASLMPPRPGAIGALRSLIAARVGPVRLIDNAAWPM